MIITKTQHMCAKAKGWPQLYGSWPCSEDICFLSCVLILVYVSGQPAQLKRIPHLFPMHILPAKTYAIVTAFSLAFFKWTQ